MTTDCLATWFDRANELDFAMRCFRNAYVRALQQRPAIGDGSAREEAVKAWKHVQDVMFNALVADGQVDAYVDEEEEP